MTLNGHTPTEEDTNTHSACSSAENQEETITTSAQKNPDGEQLTTTTTTTQGIVPRDGQLLDAVLPIRAETPSLGVPKLLMKIKEANPDWQLSEKRLRKFLNSNLFTQSAERLNNHHHQNSRLTDSSSNPIRAPTEPMWLPNYAWERDWEAASVEQSPNEPTSSLDDTLLLECRQRSVKIEPVRFPASNKGSGLIAKDYLPKGTQVLKEDAFVWVPPTKNISRSVMSGQSCAFCGRAFSMQRTKAQPSCPHHPPPGSKEAIAAQQLMVTTSTSLTTGGGGQSVVTEKPAGPEPCYMRYCTRVCAQRSVDYFGPLVCPQRNPEYMQLLRFTDAEDFRGAHMVFKLFARMLIANESGEIATDPLFKPEIPSQSSEQKLPNNGDPTPNNGHTEETSHQEPATNGSDDPNSPIVGSANNTNNNKKHKKTKSKKKALINQVPESTGPSVKFEETYSRIRGLATMSDRARREKYHGGGHLGSHFADVRYGQMWRNGWHAVIKALHINTGYRPQNSATATTVESNDTQSSSSTEAFWDSFWKRRLDPQSIAHYFGLKSFLEFVGKTSLNREADHGLYLLHARFNHSCEPNAVVLKHPGSEDIHKSAPSTIYVMTRKDIAKDEEITLSYINPDLSLDARRRKLFEDYLFSCFCTRCRKELEEEEERKHYMELMSKMDNNLNNDEIYNQNSNNLTTTTTPNTNNPNNLSLKQRLKLQPTPTSTTEIETTEEEGRVDSDNDMGFSCF
ncbi:hypothetical protein MJO29_008992 [Puccinia striiformis f. sp. tritici]|uniref:Histone-lysine N-methyltransferase SET5 n=2 Tax=Puccinia striiformis TaxID=27350 RepID=A0A0L0VX00_9BASI|nr:hypothetical protein Pst134EA_017806 [Puccinia striiformis f. sp. tritici]KAI9615870.1 hypothetical protein H4Q26_011121 [Puccinia striiformis f. sp. tritici PST-130]KNF03839.1 hypothetical protein PSTG_02932 [Puccinia striiformis f. sp. tritici PST-78]POW23437.1 hypothetical protein PSHT_00090 [Puccinia striiformis]KAH9461503.1 hypothetical protein Pst134EA_017806 [Puccinia striiformis f. sp. tritici]KAI7950318.1 hypothetical protein MJO29_008992 [Puccinia striiformis f. sp. tritici]